MSNASKVLENEGMAGADAAVPGAWKALLLLLGINLFNYIDRQVLSAVEPDIRKSLLHGVSDPRAKMGLLSGAFTLTYMVAAPLFGWMSERWSRWMLIGAGVFVWSLATGASGLAATFGMLLLTRCFVGVGEAAYGPAAPTVISDLYPVRSRGRVLSWFYMAIPVGSALGYALGGQIAESKLGWRWAFYLVVPPGLLLALISFFMREVRRGASEKATAPTRTPTLKDYAVLFRIRSYVLDTLGMAAMTFAIMGVGYWMPEYMEGRNVPGIYGLSPRLLFGAITAVSGLLATLLGGITGDALRRRFGGSYFLVSAAGLLVGSPLIILMLHTPFPAAWGVIFVAVFCLFFNTGPSNAILANVTHPSVRATAFAINIFVIHLLGDAISPTVVGWIADRAGMDAGFGFMAVVMAIGGILWLWGAKYLERDTDLAPSRI
ncbi:MAG TPA: MFS transporter [Tepidisphaeraceae bacterium]|nr:MFS transporter [Tepidisphaeraceae bacterium]